jgi:predicted PhzF superfamily epimerase YddE/YHI9
MRLPIYQVDAFTDSLFGGNPAAVCPLPAWLPDAVMQAIAAENNLSETAFFVRDGDDYAVRWFTPSVEVDLCGHATLASGYVVFRFLEPERQAVSFHTAKAGTRPSPGEATGSPWIFRRGPRAPPNRRRVSSPLWVACRARCCAPAIILLFMTAPPRSRR